MRYRPFGASYPMAVSVVSLLLEDRRASSREWRELLEAAMSAGINTFEVAGHSDALLDGLAQSLAGIERRLVFVSWRAPTIGDLRQTTDLILGRLGLDYLDMLVLADSHQVDAAQLLRRERTIRQLGLAGVDDAADHAVTLPALDAIIVPYSLMSGWRDRHRLKLASQRNMAVVAHDVWPQVLRDEQKPQIIPRGWFGKPKGKPLTQSGYRFLADTPRWSAEEICLAYALTEPAVTTVRIAADSAERVLKLAAIPEKDMPAGVAAQIEMARFSASDEPR